MPIRCSFNMEFTLLQNSIFNPRNLIICLMGIVPFRAFSQSSGQNFTLSPYSNYGIGEWSNNNLLQAGSAAATHSGTYSYSYLNPATAGNLNYTVFDFGFNAKKGKITAGDQTQTNNLGGFTYGSLAWKRDLYRRVKIDSSLFNSRGERIKKKKVFSINMGNYLAIRPITTVGYNYSFKDTAPLNYYVAHSGKGGLNAAEFGTALKFGKYFNLGYSIGYLFGQMSDNSVLAIDDTTNSNYVNDVKAAYLHGWKHNLGLYTRFTTDSIHHSFGAWVQTYSGMKASNERLTTVLGINSSGYLVVKDTLRNESLPKQAFKLPMIFGLGYRFQYKRLFAISLDYQQSDWAGSSFFFNPVQSVYGKQKQYGATFFLYPEDEKLNSEKRMKPSFRVGGIYTQTQNNFIKDGVSRPITETRLFVGSGIPLTRRYYNSEVLRSVINVQIDYIQRGQNKNGLALERYVGISFGFNLGDKWFFQRKSL